MNLKLIKTFTFFLLFVFSVSALGQGYYRRSYGDFQEPYEHTISNLKGDNGKNILKIVVEIPYDLITFEKDSMFYTGKYEITSFIYDPDYRLIADTSETVQFKLNEYEKSISKELYSVHEWNLSVPEDEDYRIIFNFTDNLSGNEINKEKKYKAEDFEREKIDLSDIVFYESEYDSVSNEEKLIPNFHGFNGKKGIVAFFEIYNKSPGDIVNIKYKVLNLKRKTVIEEKFDHEIRDKKDKVFIRIDHQKIYSGSFYIEIETKDKKKKKKKVDRNFTYMWKGIPETKAELERALLQMKYIGRGKYYDEMKKLPFEKKKEAFREFWKKRDPTPRTEQNELMEEYYWRIYFSNKAFRSMLREGWNTDRGMVFVTFGPPDDVYSETFPSDGVYYQTWFYGYLNTEIIFIDKYNTGNFKLLSPANVPFPLGDMFDLE